MRLKDYEDGELIYELIRRGFAVSKKERVKENVKEIKKEVIGNTQKSSGMFMSNREIEDRARIGADVLYGIVDGALKPKKKRTLQDVVEED